MALRHLESDQSLAEQKHRNFDWMLRHMTQRQRQWWFPGGPITHLDDVAGLPVRTALDIRTEQELNPPWGVFEFGEVLVENSGSTNGRKRMPFTLDAWLRYITPAARGLLSSGVGPGDRVLTTDAGGTQAGYRTPEEAAAWICGAQIVLDRSTSLLRKLEHIRDHGVTVLIANWPKLVRMAQLNPRKYFSHDLKLIISTGLPIQDPAPVARAFGLDWIMDYYGSSEMGNTYFSCRHGQRHVHDDFVHVTQAPGRSLFSNLSGLPLWNYDLGDQLEFSYKGRCACGSYLPTVDRFQTKSYSNIIKG